MKILYVTTIASTMVFFHRHIEMLISEGHTVELACNSSENVPEYCKKMNLTIHHLPFSRNPVDKGNLAALKQLKQIVKIGGYDIVHTHTPIASACARVACKNSRKKGLKIFYTAHGFHFYKGAEFKNWLIYCPVEWLCSFWTDKLILINKEDFSFAKKHLHAKEIIYVPGVGIDLKGFEANVEIGNKKRQELGIPEDATLLISVGELNDNKNHEKVIKAIADTQFYYIIAGEGYKHEELQQLINDLGAENRIKLLGYRTDVKELYSASNVFVFPSYREGLSVSVMEAMASGLPVACTAIRGNTDLIDENGGALFSPHSVEDAKNAILRILSGNFTEMGQYNKERVINFSLDVVLSQMREIYK